MFGTIVPDVWKDKDGKTVMKDRRAADRYWREPLVITASTPVRVCDNGGWTDTWFGGPGRVFNIAVTPGVEVSIRPATGFKPSNSNLGRV